MKVQPLGRVGEAGGLSEALDLHLWLEDLHCRVDGRLRTVLLYSLFRGVRNHAHEHLRLVEPRELFFVQGCVPESHLQELLWFSHGVVVGLVALHGCPLVAVVALAQRLRFGRGNVLRLPWLLFRWCVWLFLSLGIFVLASFRLFFRFFFRGF